MALDEMMTQPARRVEKRSITRRAMLGTGAVLLAGSIAGGAYVAWELLGDPLMDPAVADEGVKSLEATWAAPGNQSASHPFVPSAVIPGQALALLRIPDFGPTFQVPVVHGVDNDALRKGVGWFTDTAEPGQIGNCAIAGHRGARGPFRPLPDLLPGARVEIETRDAVFVYALDNHPADLTVNNTDVWVLDPVPGKPVDTKPTQALLTLITCAELFHAPTRSVAFGHLVETRPKT